MNDYSGAVSVLGRSGMDLDENDGQSKSHDWRISLLKGIVIVLGILLLVEGILYTLVMPCLSPATIEYSGLKTLTVQDLSEVLAPAGSSTWAKFDTSRAVSLLTTVSCVENVAVEKHFPDKVRIQITERESVAKTIVTVDGRSVPVQIDRNGVLFTVKNPVNDSSVPLISGLPVDKAGMRLPPKYRPLMEQIAAIRRLPQKYFAAISEIQVCPKEYGNYELVLYPIHTHVKVFTDRTLDEDQLKYMMVVLDVVKSIEPDATKIDLRYGSVSYSVR
ncbi:MAG: FtsQ-type POTRA domain-containing protein [Treponema sp.]|nr:FtsQ-type POTRA domain-containing protein [Treponema sp.]